MIKNSAHILILMVIFLMFSFILPHTGITQNVTSQTLTPALLNEYIAGIYNKDGNSHSRGRSSWQGQQKHGKCATPLIKYALAHPDWINEENEFILHRPDNPSHIRFYDPDRIASLTYNTPEGHFKIHYTESGNNAVFGADGWIFTIPQYVIAFGSYFEQAWNYEINTLQYSPPSTDGNNGGDSRFDVYILNIDYYGYSAVENGHPYCVVHNNYSGFGSNLDTEGSRTGNMKITAAHEFFHAIQYFYDDWNDNSIWWEESSSVWIEDEVFDYVDGYLNYLGYRYDDQNNNLRWDEGEPWYDIDGIYMGTSGRDDDTWFEAPQVSLDAESSGIYTVYEYGTALWEKYLSTRFGSGIIKDIYIVSNDTTDALTALQSVLPTYGSTIEEAFSDFRVRILTLDYFEEGSNYPLVRHMGNYSNYPINLSIPDFSHLSSRYIGLIAPTGNKKLTVSVNGQDNSNFTVALVLFKNSGYDLQYISMNNQSAQTGNIEVTSFGAQGNYRRATLIPMNLSSTQDSRSLTLNIQIADIQSGEEKSLNSITLSGPSAINENSYADYTATASFSDGTTQDVTSLASWVENSSYASMSSTITGRMQTQEVSSDQAITLTASYTYTTITKTASKSITITDIVASNQTTSGNNFYTTPSYYGGNPYSNSYYGYYGSGSMYGSGYYGTGSYGSYFGGAMSGLYGLYSGGLFGAAMSNIYGLYGSGLFGPSSYRSAPYGSSFYGHSLFGGSSGYYGGLFASSGSGFYGGGYYGGSGYGSGYYTPGIFGSIISPFSSWPGMGFHSFFI